jgi:hypothetical protein
VPADPFPREELVAALVAAGRDPTDADSARTTALAAPAVSSATAGLWRVEARESSDGWSFVLKVVQHSGRGHAYWQSSDHESDPMYWRREPLAYASGLVDRLEGGLRAVRCFELAERADGSIALWLEDARDPATQWSLERYEWAARHLGRAQAAFLDAPTPQPAWLSRGWLEAYVERRAADLEAPIDSAEEDEPLVRTAFPESLVGWTQAVFADRRRLFAALRALPQTLSHLDYWPRNLFGAQAPSLDETVAIDWAFVGWGALGEDIGNLVPDSLLDFFVHPSDDRALTEAAIRGYALGLAEGGWDGDLELVRFGVVLSAVLKYLWMVPWLIRRARDPEALHRMEVQSGLPAEEVYRRRGETMYLLHALWNETAGLGAPASGAHVT